MNNEISSKNNLEKYRVEKGLSQRELANIIGVTLETISLIELGKIVPSLRLALTISTALDKKFGEVFLFL